MNIKHLMIALILPSLFALTGCEADKPISATDEVTAISSPAPSVPSIKPAAKVEAPAISAPPEHCDKHGGLQHDCVKHCAEHKGKKDKICKQHCDHKAVAEHDCAKHCADHPGEKDKVCAQHCSGDDHAKAHECGTEHCADHHGTADKQCGTEHCKHHHHGKAHECGAEHCAKHGGAMSDCCDSSEQKCDK